MSVATTKFIGEWRINGFSLGNSPPNTASSAKSCRLTAIKSPPVLSLVSKAEGRSRMSEDGKQKSEVRGRKPEERGMPECRLTHFAGNYREAMNIALPRNLEDYVAELVQTANYPGSDEVVSEALREHQARRQGMEVVMTPELERLLDEGLENLDQSKTTDELRRAS